MFSRIVSTASPFAALFATLHYENSRSHGENGDKAPIRALLLLNPQHRVKQHQEDSKPHFSLLSRAHLQDSQAAQIHKTLSARYSNVFPSCATFKPSHQEHKIPEGLIIATSAESHSNSFSRHVTFKTSRGEYKIPKDRLIALNPKLRAKIFGDKIFKINTDAYGEEVEKAFFAYLKSGSYNLSRPHQEQLFDELFCLALELSLEFADTCNSNRSYESRNQTYNGSVPPDYAGPGGAACVM
jgi:hypothetical protein